MKTRKLPLSMTGDNMYSFDCEPTDRTCSYTVCQHTVWAFKEGRLRGFEDCHEAIEKRTCPAIKMMLEERKAGKSLYFCSYEARVKERERMMSESAAAERNQWRKDRMIASSKSVLDKEELKRRDMEIKAKIDAERNEVLPPKVTRRAELAEPGMDSGNMFAEIINSMTSE